MLKSIYYKEWLKTRLAATGLLVVMLLFNVYCMLNVGRIMELKGAAHIWLVVLTNDAIFVQVMRYIPLLAGLLLAVAQYVPEMMQKRIKLTLHLPVSDTASVSAMMSYGLMVLTVVFAANMAVMSLWLSHFFAAEITRHIVLTTLPWYVAGWLAYGLAAWVILEPRTSRRIMDLALSAALLRVCFMTDKPEAYNAFLPLLVVVALLVATWPLLSVRRFKKGIQ